MFPAGVSGDAGAVVRREVVRWWWCRGGREWCWWVVECVGVASGGSQREAAGFGRRLAAHGSDGRAGQGRSAASRQAGQGGVPRRRQQSKVAVNVKGQRSNVSAAAQTLGGLKGGEQERGVRPMICLG